MSEHLSRLHSAGGISFSCPRIHDVENWGNNRFQRRETGMGLEWAVDMMRACSWFMSAQLGRRLELAIRKRTRRRLSDLVARAENRPDER